MDIDNKRRSKMTTIKLTEVQEERLLKQINNLKDIVNNINEGMPLDYHTVVELPSLEFILADIFNLELPKCEHSYADRWRDYKFVKRGKKNVA
jgi:hypothetical protein